VNSDRLRKGLLPWSLVGIAGLVAFIMFFRAAFPMASLDFKVDRTEAGRLAAQFLESRGLDLSDYINSDVFGSDQTAAIFLQKTQGMEEANKLMAGEIPVWRWRCRWFRSAQKEEMIVALGTDGNLLGFNHVIEEDAAGAKLSPDSATAIAEAFLTDMGADLSELDSVETSSEEKSNRTDHIFEWKKKDYEIKWRPDDPEAGEGTLRYSIRVQGDEVGFYRYYLKVPEKFSRSIEKETGYGQLLAIVSFVLIILTIIAAAVMAMIRAKKLDAPWKLFVAVAIIAAGLTLLNTFNSFPVIKSAYQTELTYGTYVGMLVAGAVIGALAYGLWILLTGLSGHVMAAETYPESLGSIEDMRKGRVASPRIAYSCLMGYGLGFLFLGYITIFYMVGRKFLGVWLPAESPYSNVVSYYLPFLAPLAISLMAALSEEFTSRLFSISFLKRYLKLTPLALLIPAMIWAFGHSSYQVFPVYVRGIELTIGGLIFGYFFIKYDILVCVVGHYVVDAVFFATPLLRSENSYLRASGIIAIALGALPLLLGLIGIGKRGRSTEGAMQAR
jgi:hypothetical protein